MSPSMNMTSYEKEPVLEEDKYPATLKEVTEYERDFGEGPVAKLAWVFDISAEADAVEEDPEGKFDGTVECALHTSFATGKNSKFVSSGLSALVPENWDGDTDALIGLKAMADVVQYEGRDGDTRNAIDRVRPPKKARATSKAEKAEAENAAELEEIPW